jgi:cyclic pyranopterin phosphate synthase
MYEILPQQRILNQDALVDSFGRLHNYLRISITDRCNLRCTYCMPEGKNDFTASHKLMRPIEIREIAGVFVEMGVNKIRITGGEPLVRNDAREIICLLAELPVQLLMTTNATHVDSYLDELKSAGILAVNVSLDTFDREKFLKITRRDNFDKVMRNIKLLIENGLQVKLNAVMMKDVNENELCDFVEFTKEHPVQVRFIEFMPFSGNGWQREKVFSYRQMLDIIGQRYVMEKLEDEENSTAKQYKVPGFAGTFAFINTITLPFCGDCNRLRLTADGKMKNCLFSKDEMDLLGALRKGNDIRELIFSTLRNKKKQTGGQDFSMPVENRSMVAIGG